jgi:heme exporter protein CcmD
MSAEFWNMGGYAVYVWGSYGAAFLVFAWNVWAPRARRRQLQRDLAEEAGESG